MGGQSGSSKNDSTELRYDPEIPQLGTYPKELKTGSQTNIWTRILRAAHSQQPKGENNSNARYTHWTMNGHTKWHISTQRDIIWQFKKNTTTCYNLNKPYYAKSQLQKAYILWFLFRQRPRIEVTHGHRKQISDYLSGRKGYHRTGGYS